MKKEFCTYEQALALKELGFDEPCFTRYYESGKLADSLSYLHHNYFGQVNAPLYQQAFRWFREKHGLYSVIDGLEHRQYYKITQLNSCSKEYDTYEKAEQACLDKLIEIVKNKQD
jgi:hypothetical protein